VIGDWSGVFGRYPENLFSGMASDRFVSCPAEPEAGPYRIFKGMRIPLLLTAFLFAGGANAQQPVNPRILPAPADSVKTVPAFRFTPQESILPKNYATKDFGFFCRQELKLEKKTGIPLRLRLGSMEECNRIEGKQR
jgi:hypothetical protein